MSIETREGLWGCVCDTGLENLVLCSSDQDTIFITVRVVCFFVYYCAGVLTKIYTCTIIHHNNVPYLWLCCSIHYCANSTSSFVA